MRQPDRPERLGDNYCLYRFLLNYSEREKDNRMGGKVKPAGGTLHYVLLKG